MKKRIASAALCLAILLSVFCLACCGKKDNATPETTRVAETTKTNDTETPVVTTETPDSETTSPESTTSPDAETTEIPKEIYSFAFLRSSKSESISLCTGDDAEILSQRNESVKLKSGYSLTEVITTDLESIVTNGYLAGDGYDALLLNAFSEGIPLMCAGVLQDLTATGIGMSFSSSSAIESLARDFSYNGKLYLYPYTGLLSDINSSYVLTVKNESVILPSFVSALKDNTYTLETVFTALSGLEEPYYSFEEGGDETEPEGPFIGGGEEAMKALLLGAGCRVLTTADVSGQAPQSNINDSIFASVYSLVSDLVSSVTDGDESISIRKISDLEKTGYTVFPMPVYEAGRPFCTPVDPRTLTVFAATNGIYYGQQLVGVIESVAAETEGYRQNLQTLPGDDGTISKIVFANQHVELGELYTWGGIYQLAFDNLGPGGYTSLLATSDLSKRLAAAKSAAEIIRKRLDN